MNGPSVGEPGYLPYCGRCSGLVRMRREAAAFKCGVCGLETRNVNGEDMFDRTAPAALRVGDVVPLPPRKLDIRPAPCSDNRPSFKPGRNGKR